VGLKAILQGMNEGKDMRKKNKNDTILQLFIMQQRYRDKDEIDMILVSNGWEILRTLSHYRLLSISRETLESKYDFHGESLDKILNKVGSIVYNNSTFVVNVENDVTTTIDDVKRQLSIQTGVDTREMRFIYSGKQLQDGRTLSSYDIMDNDTIHWFIRLRGD
jgi:hypothetical protein